MHKDVKIEIEYNGCKKKIEYPTYTEELGNLSKTISKEYLQSTIYVEPMNRKQAIREGKLFLARHFTLHPVWILDPKKVHEQIPPGGVNLKRLFEIEREVEKYVHPFDLKVLFSNKYGIFGGEVKSRTFLREWYDTCKYCASIKGIHLSSRNTIVTPAVYVHEVTHTQVQNVPGSVRYIKNLELLSYFLELVCAYEQDPSEHTLKLVEKYLANELIQFTYELDYHRTGAYVMNESELLSTGKYLNSTLGALYLFMTYYYGSINTKKEILRQVQQLFDGNRDLEEILKQYDIKGDIDTPRLMKHFKRT